MSYALLPIPQTLAVCMKYQSPTYVQYTPAPHAPNHSVLETAIDTDQDPIGSTN